MTLNVNDRLHGFRVDRIRDVSDRKGTLYEMTHEKTGAQLIWLKRDDENKTFCIGFKTIPEDSSGVFHICEHSVLNGSRKYPVREPFVDLLKSSMHTFLNAMTYPDKTIYPVSSRNPKDFLNLMDVYLDAVLHPAIYTNPNIFYQEGWHYEIRDPKDDPVYKGVVLNEMKGDFSSVDEVLMNETQKVLFPDNSYRFVSGGDPEKITELTYEQFLAAHAKFYHPSNSRTVLDGDLDIDAALAKIDSFFAEYDNENMSFPIARQTPVKPCRVQVPYEIGKDEDPKEKTEIAFSRVICDYDEIEKQLAWRVLSTVLTGSNDAPLKKAIIGGKLGQDVELALMDEIMQPFILLVIRNTDPEKKEAIRNTVRKTIDDLVSGGLRKEELIAILNQMEFHYREQKEPAGVMLAQTAYQSWIYDGDPAMFLTVGDLYETLRKKAATGYFEELLKEGFAEGTLSEIVAVPDASLSDQRLAKEKERLRAAKASWGDEISRYIELNKALDIWQAAEDTPEQKATLPQLKIEDVEKKPKQRDPEMIEVNHVPVIVHPESATGIVYMNYYFNLAGVTKEHLPEIALLCDLLTRLRTEDHTLSELQEEIRGNLGTLSFFADAFTVNREKETCYPVLGVSCSVLRQNTDRAIELILEIIQKTVFEKDTIFAILQQSKENFRQMFIGGGHAASVLRIGAGTSAESLAKESFNGYTAASFVNTLVDQYEDRYEEIISSLQMYCEELFTKARLTASISGHSNIGFTESLIEALPAGNAQRCKVHYPLLAEGDEGIQVPSQISFAARGNNMQKYSYEYGGPVRVAAQILTYGYLWNEIRVKGGSYGTGFAASPSGNVACWSYRDPSPEASLKAYRKAADYICELCESKPDLTSYIIGTIAAAEPLQSEGVKIRSADGRWLSGITYDTRLKLRTGILTTTCEDLERFAGAMRQCIDEGKTCVVGSAEKLKECGIKTIHTIGLSRNHLRNNQKTMKQNDQFKLNWFF